MLAAATLADERIRLTNFPTELRDVQQKIRYLNNCGVETKLDEKQDTIEILTRSYDSANISDFNYPIRTTYLLAAGQLRRGQISLIPYPGGCKLGERKFDLHIMVWEKFGCEVTMKENHILITPRNFKGCEIDFPISTVGGTENALLCAVTAPGTTIIRNAYITPEIENLIQLLRNMGAEISVIGTSGLVIEGKTSLAGTSFPVMPDRIEALTWIVFAAVTGGALLVENVPISEMEIPLIHLRSMGIQILQNDTSVYISPSCISTHGIQPFELATGTHPGIISDMQPFYVIAGLAASGRSIVHDYRYPERVKYLEELSKFCPGSISWEFGKITINNNAKLRGASVRSTDLRGSMAVVLGAFMADGESEVHGVEMALRGYNKLDEKLRCVGVQFELAD